MKKKKILLIILILIVVIGISSLTVFKILNDKDRLSVNERQWINNNKNNVISINVINDLNVFGKNGSGIYFDFLEALSEKYEFEINPVTFNAGDAVTGTTLGYSLDSKAINTFYEDEFVLVSKKEEIITDFDSIKSYKIGTLNEYKSYIESYFKNTNEYVSYNTKDELLKVFKETEELNYIIVPKIMYLDQILANNLQIVYHVSDAKIYYGAINDGSELSNIVNKYFKDWKENNFEESKNINELSLFVTNLNIQSADIDQIKANTYKYGFVNNGPYEMISGGTFGGINAVYLKKFADLVDIKIDFVKYNSIEKLQKAIDNKKVDIYFDYHNIDSKLESISSNVNLSVAIIADKNNSMSLNSLVSLSGKEVYVENNSKIYEYLKEKTSIDLKVYKNEKELKKLIKNKKIIALDLNKYESLKNSILKNYSLRYSENINDTYKYKVGIGSTFNKLLNKYFQTLDNNEMKYIGLNNYYETVKNGTLLGTLAKYILVLLSVFVIIIIIVYKKGQKIKIAKKIKKEDKMRFIDQLTSLKNRNYLTENLENWNNNTIYPQAVIVLDLNKLQDINDTLGYEKGDTQIQAVANILIKTQLDNTDIIRTDGNEFLIYLVGYEVKQITSYIHKLNKEFKKLPFDYGVAVGYSMITDDVKSVEDATNEAVEQVKAQKEEKKDE